MLEDTSQVLSFSPKNVPNGDAIGTGFDGICPPAENAALASLDTGKRILFPAFSHMGCGVHCIHSTPSDRVAGMRKAGEHAAQPGHGGNVPRDSVQQFQALLQFQPGGNHCDSTTLIGPDECNTHGPNIMQIFTEPSSRSGRGSRDFTTPSIEYENAIEESHAMRKPTRTSWRSGDDSHRLSALHHDSRPSSTCSLNGMGNAIQVVMPQVLGRSSGRKEQRTTALSTHSGPSSDSTAVARVAHHHPFLARRAGEKNRHAHIGSVVRRVLRRTACEAIRRARGGTWTCMQRSAVTRHVQLVQLRNTRGDCGTVGAVA